MAEVKTERYRRIRGALLKLLAHEHPGCIDFQVLQFLLDDLRYVVTPEEMKSHLSYLKEKGFLDIEKRTTTGIAIEMACILPDGLDLLDGFKTDVGVNTRF